MHPGEPTLISLFKNRCSIEHYPIAKLLLDKKAAVNAQSDIGNIALHHAKEVKSAQLLIDRKAFVDTQNIIYGWTPLHYATKTGNYEIASLLLQQKARVDILSKSGKSVLFMARMANHSNVVQLLRQYGAK